MSPFYALSSGVSRFKTFALLIAFALAAIVFGTTDTAAWKSGPIRSASPGFTPTSTYTGTSTPTGTLTPTPTPITVSLPGTAGAPGSVIVLPMTISDLTGRGITSYSFQITFDPNVLQPASPPIDLTGTLSSGMSITPNTSIAGHFIVDAFSAIPLTGSGSLIYLRFNVVGTPPQFTTLAFQDYSAPGGGTHPGFDPPAQTSDGQVSVTLSPSPTVSPSCTPATHTFSYTGPEVSISDNNPAGVNLTIPVNGVVGTISDLNFRFDGIQNPDAGSTTPAINHSWVGDLIVKLTSPSGTTVTMFDRPRVPPLVFGCSSNNLAELTLDDDGGFPQVEEQCGAGTNAAFPTGTFAPNNALNAFDNQNANGDWTINISDVASDNIGWARAFSLVIGSSCVPTTSTPTNTSTSTPTSTPTPLSTCPPERVIWDQMSSTGTGATASQNFEVSLDSFDSILTDDFQVGSGEVVVVDKITVRGKYFNGSGPVDSFNVNSHTNLGYTQNGDEFTIPLPPSGPLGRGIYFISVQANMDFAKGGQWAWLDRDPIQFGFPATWQNPGGGYGISQCTNSPDKRGAVCGIDPGFPEQAFRIEGHNYYPNPCAGTPTASPTATWTPTAIGSPTPTHSPAATNTMTPTPPASPVCTPQILWNQLSGGNGTSGTASQDFEASFDAYDSMAADDFQLGSGVPFVIQKVIARGAYFNGSGPADSFNLTFYNSAGPSPGNVDQVFTGLSYTQDGDRFIIDVPNFLTNHPTGWVSVQARMDYAPGGQWAWLDREQYQFGVPARWANPGGGYSIPQCINFAPRGATCGIDPSFPDQAFEIIGFPFAGCNMPTLTPSATFTATPPPTATATPTPSGSYPNATISLSSNAVITPSAPPTHTTSMNVATNTNFKGKLEGDPATGVVYVTDAHPAGTYPVTVKEFDGPNVTATKLFNLTVNTPTTCNSVSFTDPVYYDVGDEPNAIAVGDFNKDGKQDLATANRNSDTVSILTGDGAGHFGPANSISVGSDPYSLAVGDLNGDGDQDIVVANINSASVSVLLGDGTGIFSVSNVAVSGYPVAAAIGDFNNDGKQDVGVTSGAVPWAVIILLGDGAGNLVFYSSFSAGNQPTGLEIGQFNNDGLQDLAVGDQGGGPHPVNGSLVAAIGNGLGDFSPSIAANNIYPTSLAISDLNGDGNQDIAVTDGGVKIMFGNGLGNFSSPVTFAGTNGPVSIGIGDFNGDGKPDLAVANFGNSVSIYLGNGLGGFSSPTDLPASGNPHAIVVGDFNGDGKQDLAVPNVSGDNVSIYLRDCASVNGAVTYGNAVGSPSPRPVSNVLINGAGSSPVSTTSGFPNGNYSLSGFGSGSYLVTPTKNGGVNGITSFDAARIAQHVAGTNTLTGNQLIVADTSGNGSVTSFDAGQIARYVAASPGVGATGNWIFEPANRSYASVGSNISGQDYSALLMGEVSGNWTNSASRQTDHGRTLRPASDDDSPHIVVEIPRSVPPPNKEIAVPVNIKGVAGKDIISYEFDLRYDPSVVKPLDTAVDLIETVSRGLSVVTNDVEPGLLRVVVYGALPINEDGVLLHLRFTAVGSAGSVSPLRFERVLFNEGQPVVTITEGSIEIF